AFFISDGLNRPRTKRNRLGRIGNILVIAGVARLWFLEPEFEASAQVKRRRLNATAALTSNRPRRQPTPRGRARLERHYWWHIGFGCALFEILIQKWTKNLCSKI